MHPFIIVTPVNLHFRSRFDVSLVWLKLELPSTNLLGGDSWRLRCTLNMSEANTFWRSRPHYVRRHEENLSRRSSTECKCNLHSSLNSSSSSACCWFTMKYCDYWICIINAINPDHVWTYTAEQPKSFGRDAKMQTPLLVFCLCN